MNALANKSVLSMPSKASVHQYRRTTATSDSTWNRRRLPPFFDPLKTLTLCSSNVLNCTQMPAVRMVHTILRPQVVPLEP